MAAVRRPFFSYFYKKYLFEDYLERAAIGPDDTKAHAPAAGEPPGPGKYRADRDSAQGSVLLQPDRGAIKGAARSGAYPLWQTGHYFLPG